MKTILLLTAIVATIVAHLLPNTIETIVQYKENARLSLAAALGN